VEVLSRAGGVGRVARDLRPRRRVGRVDVDEFVWQPADRDAAAGLWGGGGAPRQCAAVPAAGARKMSGAAGRAGTPVEGRRSV
jgi:hypothetical protein